MISQETLSRVNASKKALNRSTGAIAEDIACKYIEKRGIRVIDRNYRKKWGELDIIGTREGGLHFFEVKSTTARASEHRPEENVHSFKASQIRRMIRTFLMDNDKWEDAEFRFHVISVRLDMAARIASVKWLKDIIL